MRFLFRLASYLLVFALGFAAGIYALPILTAPPAPNNAEIQAVNLQAKYTAQFRRELIGSDFFHWGDGVVRVSDKAITLQGELAPGPDYKLYLVPRFVETENAFLSIKDQSQLIGDVKTFKNFMVDVPAGTDIEAYNTVLVWCETFGEFISAAQYR